MDEAQLRTILAGVEDYNLELKTAGGTFSRNKLHDYCAGISNVDGGYLILGVNNDRQIIGTQAFLSDWNMLANQLTTNLQVRVKVHVVHVSEGRVIVFTISRHNTGTPVQARGGTGNYTYPIRDGESLVEMSPQALEDIFAERETDWSAQTASDVTIEDLDPEALNAFRQLWSDASRDESKLELSFDRMLGNIGLTVDGLITNAAVLLMGKAEVIARVIPDAEIIFEWRNNGRSIPYGERKNWRKAFVLINNDIWATISARNTAYRLQDGFVQREVLAYDEETIREAVINAFAHRDYTLRGRSIVIKLDPEQFSIENPGRLMPGITLENIFDRSAWRNRLLAESMEKIRLMERSSQGVDTIYLNTIKAGKGVPKYEVTADPSVALKVPAVLTDQEFVGFIEQLVQHTGDTLSTREYIELDSIRRGEAISNGEMRDKLINLGLIEATGTGRGRRYILSRRYYRMAGALGEHTRLTGLSRAAKEELVLNHIRRYGSVKNIDIQQAFPEMDMPAASDLLKIMRRKGQIEHIGSARSGHWVEANTAQNA